ncbi:hypothetical protein [Pseudoalteromonas piscicida]|uniref:hypothetical protein n=1 Tax=Pseudoalteromonas piscicida TaxID=43662 RepID=UPI0030A5A1E5
MSLWLWFLLAMYSLIFIAILIQINRKAKEDKFLNYLGLFLSFTAVIVFTLYFNRFGIDPRNENLSDWVSVATYFNNAFSPFLLLATIALLYKTWDLSKKELRDTRTLLKEQIRTARYPTEIESVRYKITLINERLRMDCTHELKCEGGDRLTRYILANPQSEATGYLDYVITQYAEQNGMVGLDFFGRVLYYQRNFLVAMRTSVADVLTYKQQHLANIENEHEQIDNKDPKLLFRRFISNVLYPMIQSPNSHLYSELFVIEQYQALLENIVAEGDEELQRMMKKEVKFLMLREHRNTLDHYVELTTQVDKLLHRFAQI